MAISKSSRKLSSASRASTEKKKRNTQKWPVQKRLSLATQTPLMNPLMLWNLVKGFLARRDMRSVLSNLTPGNQVNIENSDSDDDRKMPAKISRKNLKGQ
jgi:hypothetical protein